MASDYPASQQEGPYNGRPPVPQQGFISPEPPPAVPEPGPTVDQLSFSKKPVRWPKANR
jgi:hypothetical protein